MDPKAAFVQKLTYIEQQVALLNQGANPEAAKNLLAAITLRDPGDQSKNNAWYITAPPKVDTVEDPGSYTPPPGVTHPMGKSASFAILQSNMKMAEEIVEMVRETDVKIDALVTAGRKFNASKARADLHTVVGTLTDMMRQVDLAEPWTTGDMLQLQERASEIHKLFAPAKV